MLKAFKVTGYAQYKTDSAIKVERTQIARNPVEAVAMAKGVYGANYTFCSFTATEIKESL